MTTAITDNTMNLAREMAYEAGRKLLDCRGRVIGKPKGFRDFVSEADLAAESVILGSIQVHFPDHSILAEESGEDNHAGSEYLWLVDPLDGTKNYLWGIPIANVSIALAYRGKVRLGVVYDPWRDEMVWGREGHGVHLNDTPVQVTNHRHIHECIVCTDYGYSGERIEITAALSRSLQSEVAGLRAFGCAALTLAYVACGRLDAYFNYGFNAWDMAAGAFLVEEAGGKSTNLLGGPEYLHTRGCLSSNSHIHDEILSIWHRENIYQTSTVFAAMASPNETTPHFH